MSDVLETDRFPQLAKMFFFRILYAEMVPLNFGNASANFGNILFSEVPHWSLSKWFLYVGQRFTELRLTINLN